MSKLPNYAVLRAVIHGRIAGFEQLCLDNIESIDVKQSENSKTAMHYAAIAGYTKVIEILHRLGSKSLDAVDSFGDTPMHYAAKEGHVAVIELLCKLGSKAVTMKSAYGSIPLHLAVLCDRTNVIEFFYSHQRDIITKEDRLLTILMETACVLSHFKTILMMHKCGSEFCATEKRNTLRISHSTVTERAITLYHSRSLTEVLFFTE